MTNRHSESIEALSQPRTTGWVHFRALKETVSVENILQHYDLVEKLRPRKDELVGPCPFHQETKGSFRASLTKNAFQCFGWKRKGNILDSVVCKEVAGRDGRKERRFRGHSGFGVLQGNIACKRGKDNVRCNFMR